MEYAPCAFAMKHNAGAASVGVAATTAVATQWIAAMYVCRMLLFMLHTANRTVKIFMCAQWWSTVRAFVITLDNVSLLLFLLIYSRLASIHTHTHNAQYILKIIFVCNPFIRRIFYFAFFFLVAVVCGCLCTYFYSPPASLHSNYIAIVFICSPSIAHFLLSRFFGMHFVLCSCSILRVFFTAAAETTTLYVSIFALLRHSD